MVFCLRALLQQAQRFVSISSGFRDHLQELGFADVIGAGTSHQDSAGTKHFQGAQVEFWYAQTPPFDPNVIKDKEAENEI